MSSPAGPGGLAARASGSEDVEVEAFLGELDGVLPSPLLAASSLQARYFEALLLGAVDRDGCEDARDGLGLAGGEAPGAGDHASCCVVGEKGRRRDRVVAAAQLLELPPGGAERRRAGMLRLSGPLRSSQSCGMGRSRRLRTV